MKLSFIWNMHQPDYRDASGVMQMPWVFLHAIKDYYDMPWMMARHDGIKATFNITPPLIQQLKLYYKSPQENDKFLSLWLKDPNLLDEDETKFVIKFCKSAHYETMVAPFPRYKELFNQKHFNNAEMVDLGMLFILSWCGVYLRRNNDIVKYLINKQRDYSYDDKISLINELSKFVSTIFEYYSKLRSDGCISIATSPLNHPILPLLMDMKNALIANPNTNIPKDHIKLEDDALMQIQRANDLFLETFGFLPDGFWPAEGAVDQKSVELLSSCGVKWIATDEEILFKSLNSRDRKNLYTSYLYRGMCIAFRDHTLSDLVGFTYRYKEPIEATANFMSELEKIEQLSPNGTVFVILDGENAWEFYKNNAFDFFDSLYKNLQNSSWCETLTMEEVSKVTVKELPYLATGSWINGNFNTWVGNSEKTRAWDLIYLTKRDYEHHQDNLDEDTKSKIVNLFLIAECSDWFWWYGDDHFTEFGAEFDELFRYHLINIYDLIKITPPADLFVPIIKGRSTKHFWLKPQSDISPIIDGKRNSFFEWIGCGVVDESKLFSTMDRVRGPIKKILYGQDDEKLYFAFEARMKELCQTNCMYIIIDPIDIKGKIEFQVKQTYIGKLAVNVACESLLEISIDKKDIKEDKISIRFELEHNGSVVQTLPGFGELKIDLGNDYSQNWFV